ncbi:MAG: JDVT-CTERM system glutamic-type intramembrane protease [Mariprofundaceae bacterium]|nr:JDVT-CTERM system glutamic-type intramembrane protease [Mariprofundaceae bacterium]
MIQRHWQLLSAYGLGVAFWLAFYLWQQAPIRWGISLSMWQTLLVLALLYPILEELLFRGLIQTWLLEKTWGHIACWHVSLANMLTSLLFMTLHFFQHPPLWAMAVFIPSLIFGYLREHYGQTAYPLLPSISVHCFYNTGWFYLFALRQS